MAKYLIMLEDTNPQTPDAPVDIQVHQFFQPGEDPVMPTPAGKLARYVQLKLAEVELAVEQDRAAKAGLLMEEAARCCH